jgi:hypothetical protein
MKPKRTKKKSLHQTQTRRRPHLSRIKVAPRTPQQYLAMSPNEQDLWDAISQVPGRMRSDNVSLAEACRDLGVSPDEVLRLARPAFRKLADGQYVAKARDEIFRMLCILSEEGGLVEFPVTDSREASLIGRFWNAVQQYLRRGDPFELNSLRHRTVRDSTGKRSHLLTNLKEIERQAYAGVLRFESIYGAIA